MAGTSSGRRCSKRGVRPVPPVDGLVGVAHHAQIVSVAADGPDQTELGGVDVLELVDRQVPVPPTGPFGEGLVGLERVGGQTEQVVEIDGAPPTEGALVGAEGLAYAFGRDDGLAPGSAAPSA